MSTHEVYCSIDTCKLLKQAGFDWYCPQSYDLLDGDFLNVSQWDYENLGGMVYAPTLSVAQKWLREVKGVDVYAVPCNGLYVYNLRNYHDDLRCDFFELASKDSYDTYESALEAGINKCLTILLKEE